MKYKIIGATSFAILCVITVIFSFFVADVDKVVRTHHHMWAEPKKMCDIHSETDFCSHLPVVAINTGGKRIPGDVTGAVDRFNESVYSLTDTGESMEKVTVQIFDNASENNHLTDTPAVESEILIRKRGHASRSFEKAQYALKFISPDGLEKDISVMGMDEHNEWILNGPYLDKSLIRNYMFYNISGEIMEYAPNVRYCEMFLDGEYQGIYLMCESITSGSDCRLDLTFTEKDNKITGYLLRLDRPTEEDLGMTRDIFTMSERQNYGTGNFIVKYPGRDNLTSEMAKTIELEISQFDKAVYSYDYDSKEFGYKSYIDVNSFVDYFIINEFSKNLDSGAYSTYIYKRPTEKYKMCVWDFNNACDNYPDDYVGFMGFSVYDKLYFNPLCRDEDFVEAVISRYFELRETYLSEEYLMNYIDDTVMFLGDATERNGLRWSQYLASDPLIPYERNPHTHKEAIEMLKSWIINRGRWLDENIDTLRQYCATSKVKKFNEVTE